MSKCADYSIKLVSAVISGNKNINYIMCQRNTVSCNQKVLPQGNMSLSCYRRPVDTENGWRRVECVIVCPIGEQSQSMAADIFKKQIIAILHARKFSVAGSEVASCKELTLDVS